VPGKAKVRGVKAETASEVKTSALGDAVALAITATMQSATEHKSFFMARIIREANRPICKIQ
jgi:hypothetical protein